MRLSILFLHLLPKSTDLMFVANDSFVVVVAVNVVPVATVFVRGCGLVHPPPAPNFFNIHFSLVLRYE